MTAFPLAPTCPYLVPTLAFPPKAAPTPTLYRGVGVVGGRWKSHPTCPHLATFKLIETGPQIIAENADRDCLK